MGSLDFTAVYDAMPVLWQGMQISVLLAAFGIIGGLLLGIVLAILRLSPLRILSHAAAIYVDFLRSIPLVLLVFWFYFLVPMLVGHNVDGFYAAVIGFILVEGADFCEIIRSGIESVRRGQIMAGLASGFTPRQCMRLIVLPQAFRAMLPVLLMQAINVLKSTPIVYVIGLRDFLTAAELMGSTNNRLSEMYIFVAVVFFVVCWLGSQAVGLLQRRFWT
jgi:glutamate/aspartate transport system permease protein